MKGTYEDKPVRFHSSLYSRLIVEMANMPTLGSGLRWAWSTGIAAFEVSAAMNI